MDFQKIKELYDTNKQIVINLVRKEIKKEYNKECDLLMNNQDTILSKKYIIDFNLMDGSRYIGITSNDIKTILHEEYNIPIENIKCNPYEDDREFDCDICEALYHYWNIKISI